MYRNTHTHSVKVPSVHFQMLQNLVLLLVLTGPLLLAEGQEFGGYVDVVYICGVCACPQRAIDLLQ